MSRREVFAVIATTTLMIVAVVAPADWDRIRPLANPVELALNVMVGVAFVAAGVAARRFRPHDNTGRLMISAGELLIARGFILSRNPVASTAGAALTAMYVPVLIQLVLGFPSGRLQSRWERWFVGCCYVFYPLSAATGLLFYNPDRASSRVRSPVINRLLIRDNPTTVHALQLIFGAIGIGIGVAIIGVLLVRWRSGTAAYRAAFAPLWITGIVGTVVSIGATLVDTRSVGAPALWTSYLRFLATALWPAAVVVGLWRYRVARSAVSNVMIEIGAAPLGEGFLHALRRALRDPDLVLWSWSPQRGTFLDSHGDPQVLPDGDGPLAATVLERDGVPVGALVYDQSLQDQPQLLAAVRSAATLAMDNQRLQLELQAQLREIRESRGRIVAAGDAGRRQLERNLHDGAQQRLVAAAILLRRAHRASDDQHLRELLAQGTAELDSALVELRELARGVYPPVLQERGLPAALNSLAERAPLPVEITDTLPDRPPPPVELAAYFIAAEAVANATKHSSATHIEISLHQDNDVLRMIVSDNGCGGATLVAGGGLSGLTDRASALGGRLTLHSPVGGGTTLTLTLPLTDTPEDPT